MKQHRMAALVLLVAGAPLLPLPALAENPMGYRLQTTEASPALRPSGGSLEIKVGPEKEITSGG